MTTEQTPDNAAAAPAEEFSPEDAIESLRAELEQVRAQSLLDRADLENQRRRLERDVQNACRYANRADPPATCCRCSTAWTRRWPSKVPPARCTRGSS
nr:hypothetical protein [Luteimonas granuli]